MSESKMLKMSNRWNVFRVKCNSQEVCGEFSGYNGFLIGCL